MTSLQHPTPRITLALALVAVMSLSACATKSDRRGPPPDRQERGGQDRAIKTSGTFMHPVAALFSQMDEDRDKVVTPNEVAKGADAEWASFTQNPSAIQFSRWSVETLGSTDAMPNFMSFDRDFNGVISKAEFTSQLDREFVRLDKNGDGQLTRGEMLIAFEAPRGRAKQGGQESGQKRGKGGDRGGRPPR